MRVVAFGKEIAMGDVGLVDSLAEFFGAVNVASDFDAVFDFTFDALRILLMAEFTGRVIAIFLEEVKVTR